MAVINPSLFAVDFARLGEGLEAIRRAGAETVHIDVCDGHFAPGITVGIPVIAGLRKATGLVFDVHLQVERPGRFVMDFVAAGADRLAVHPESTPDLESVLHLIRSKGVHAGAALNPATPVEALSEVFEELDYINILSGESDAAEQLFFSRVLRKVGAALRFRREQGAHFAVQVEGVTGGERVTELAEAGADRIVVGPGMFNHSNVEEQLRDLLRQASQTCETLPFKGVITGSE